MKKTLQIILVLSFSLFSCQTLQDKTEILVNNLGYFDGSKNALFEYHIQNIKTNASKSDSIKINAIEKKLTDKEIYKRLSAAFNETFTEKEISDIYNFYNSSSGQKFLKSQISLNEKVKDNFSDIYREIKLIEENQNQSQEKQASYITNFFESEIERKNGFYLVKEVKTNNASKFEVAEKASITFDQIENAKVTYDNLGNPTISIKFDKIASENFKDLTTANNGKGVAIILNHKIITMPVINEPIVDGKLTISGGLTVEKAEEITKILKK